MRCTCEVSSRQGNARSAEMVTPAASRLTAMASAGTPGSATCTCSASPASMMSTGGSQATAAWVKNWRCRRSARSSIDSASLHIQREKSREVIGVMWRRPPRESRVARKSGSEPDLPEIKEELLLAVGHFPALGRRADVQVAEVDAPAGDVVGRNLERHAVARDDADMALAHLAAGIREHARAVRQRDAELRVRQHLLHGAFHLDELFFRHRVAQYVLSRT